MMKKQIARREFIRKSTWAGISAGVTAGAVSRSFASAPPPSDQVVVGILGTGRQGMFNLIKFSKLPEVRIAAVCDVYQPHLDRAVQATAAEGYSDFRRILERSDIDAVVISSPDHWHPLMSVLACQAGKDVYVEKPISVTIDEGRKMVEAARTYDRVVQVGTQQRSGLHFQKAVELVRNGEIGPIAAVRTWNFGNSFPEGIGNPPDADPPADLDWDLWLGPAPEVPFNANRFGVGPDRWSTFRYFWDYAGGMMTDWGVHLLDIVQWAMNVKGPKAVSAAGGNYLIKDNRETPDTLTATFEYPGFICTYENRSTNGRPLDGHGYGIEFYGTRGTLFVDRRGYEVFPENRRENDQWIPLMEPSKAENSNDHNENHVADFLASIRSRRRPVSDIEAGHESTAVCHLGNIAYRTGRRIVWDVESERIRDDPEASRYLSREYREPWKLGG